jgi:hypothetical protein
MTLDMLWGIWGTLAVILGLGVLSIIGVVVGRSRWRAHRYRKINKAIDEYAHRYRNLSPQDRHHYRLELVIATYGFFRNQDAINRCHAALRVLNEERMGS